MCGLYVCPLNARTGSFFSKNKLFGLDLSFFWYYSASKSYTSVRLKTVRGFAFFYKSQKVVPSVYITLEGFCFCFLIS